MILSVEVANTMVTSAQVMGYTSIAVVALIVFLSLKVIISSETENKQVKSFIKGSNIAIVSLLLIFIFILAYQVRIAPLK